MNQMNNRYIRSLWLYFSGPHQIIAIRKEKGSRDSKNEDASKALSDFRRNVNERDKFETKKKRDWMEKELN